MRRHITVAVVSVAAVASGLSGPMTAAPAAADIAHTKVVSDNPVDNTPHVKDGTVRAYAVVGSMVVVGGTFTKVQQAGTRKVFDRTGIFAYNKSTGAVSTAFAPKLLKSSKDINGNFLPGEVYALQPGDNGTVYAAGYYTTVNGATVRSLSRLKLADGTNDTGFKGQLGSNAGVRALIRRGGHLYAGGTFTSIGGASRTMLARLNAVTGVADPNFNFTLAGPLNGGSVKVESIAVNPQNTKVVFDGNFSTVDGADRVQVAMVNVTDTSAALSGWATSRYGNVCNTSAFETYVRDVDFDPTGNYFVLVTTGGPFGTSTLCDSAARWDATKTTAGQQPVWVNYTGGDTLLSVCVTGVAVYVGGHQRWLDNAYGRDNPGPGAVERPGIGALDPETGKALPWNPTRTRGHGAEVLMASTDGGLFVGSDTDELGHEWHQRVGFFPAP
ncbi:MAG TPA: hypothetical protein VFU43_00400 [Streptosporangiaceae bacterium]|nr:hypothetical protein [Streptosporangiaceae bacterium]